MPVPSRRRATSTKCCGQQRNVLAPFAERWNVQWKYGQPVKEIGAETASLDFMLEISVCRCNHSNVDAMHTIGSDTLNLALLQGA
jgi:hypothetical protein